MVNIPVLYSGGPGFKSRLENGYPDRGFSFYTAIPPGKWKISTLNGVMATFIHIIYNSSFTNNVSFDAI
jgi:hypothetical protein